MYPNMGMRFTGEMPEPEWTPREQAAIAIGWTCRTDWMETPDNAYSMEYWAVPGTSENDFAEDLQWDVSIFEELPTTGELADAIDAQLNNSPSTNWY